MRYIKKIRTGKGYRELLQIHQAGGCYEDTKDDNSKNPPIKTRTNILQDLLQEQGYICAYCMRRISLENATIEHIIGQSYKDEDGKEIGKGKDTDYNNMLAVCNGNSCKKGNHCDKSRSESQSKGRVKLFISPLKKSQMENIRFTHSGKIYYKNLDEESKENFDLNKVLNLNCSALVESRKRILENIRKLHNYNKDRAKKLLETWEEKNPEFKEYCQIAIFELKKYV